MSFFIVVGSTPFDGSQSVTIRDKTDPAFPEDFTIFPKSRDTPASAWRQLGQIATQSYTTINSSKHLTAWNYADYDLIFSSAALASAFGFSSTTTSGSGGSTITAGTALTAFEFMSINMTINRSGAGVSGHGASAYGAQKSTVTIDAVGTRANASNLISSIEHNGYISIADTSFGGIPWTLHVNGVKYKSAGLDLAQLEINGTTRI